MTHPHDLLASYVDGTLPHGELGPVERHLATCERCRIEVELARPARASLRDLPVPQVPTAVGSRAIAEATRTGAWGDGPASAGPARPAAAPDHPAWYRWIGAAAAAAAVVLALVVVAPNLGGSDDDAATTALAEDAAEGGASGEATLAPAFGIEPLERDLQHDDLAALAEDLRDIARAASTVDAGAPEAVSAEDGPLTEATACLREAFPSVTSAPVRLFETTFEGTPAYAGLFFVGGTGDGVDTIQVVVAAKRNCQILSTAAARV